MVKIQDFYFDMPCHLSNEATVPAHYFFEIFSLKHMEKAQISSTDRLTGSFISMTPAIKRFAQGMQKSIFAPLLYFICTF